MTVLVAKSAYFHDNQNDIKSGFIFARFFGKCKQVFVRNFELDDFLEELDKIFQWVRQIFQWVRQVFQWVRPFLNYFIHFLVSYMCKIATICCSRDTFRQLFVRNFELGQIFCELDENKMS